MISGYDYSSREAREKTVEALFGKARKERTAVEADWDSYDRMVEFQRTAMKELEETDEWTAPVMPDAWIQVESSVVTEIPEPEFRGRDSAEDSEKARTREYVVRYICDNNHLKDMTVEQEKTVITYGDAFFKAYWDSSMRCGKDEGDIRIIAVSPRNIYPDPSVPDARLEDCEYVDYVYTMHKVEFQRRYRREIKKAGLEAEDLVGKRYTQSGSTEATDTVEVLEHWFKQPEDGEDCHEGCIACCIMVAGHEIKYIPNYWENTWRQCREYPFRHYWRIRKKNSFWNYSELFPIADMLYAADRKLAMGSINDALMSNDIILVEEDALCEGEELTNEPGAVVRTKPGRGSAVRRLGGIQSMANSAVTLEWYSNQIERTTRNYETSRGKEAQRTNTATGLAMLRADADSQQRIKQADRDRGYERLYRLLDQLALEFFDDGRMIFLGEDPTTGRGKTAFAFNSREFTETMPEILDDEGNTVREEYLYYPEVDVSITASDALISGVSQTIQALDSLIDRIGNANENNYKLFIAMLNKLRLPEAQDIIKDLRKRFETAMMPAESGGGQPTAGKAPITMPTPTEEVPREINGVPTNI